MPTQQHENFRNIDVVEVVSNHGFDSVQKIEFVKIGNIVPFSDGLPDIHVVLETMNNGSLCACNFHTMMELVMPNSSLIVDERAEHLLFIGGALIRNSRRFIPSLRETYTVHRCSGKKIPVKTWFPALIPESDVFHRMWTKRIAVFH